MSRGRAARRIVLHGNGVVKKPMFETPSMPQLHGARFTRRLALSAALALWAAASAAHAQFVGEPTGFTITVRQGASVLATRPVTIGPGGDLQDIKISDGDSEDFVQIGTLPGNNPMILKVVSDDDAMFRVLHMYINAPLNLGNIYTPGPVSLFNPANPDPIDVSITNMTFAGGTQVIPQLQNNTNFFTAFMRDMDGHFYEMPGANAYNSFGHGVNDIQVPGQQFLDGNPGQYAFSSMPGSIASLAWSAIPNPGPTTTVNTGPAGGQPSSGGGYVFELGLAVAFTAVPEPSTALLLALGTLALVPGRRRGRERLTQRRGGR